MLAERDLVSPSFAHLLVESDDHKGGRQLCCPAIALSVKPSGRFFAGTFLLLLFVSIPAGCEGEDVKTLAKEHRSVVLGEHPKGVDCVVFSPDGKTVVSGGHDGSAKIWDVASLKNLRVLKWGSWVQSVAFSPDGSLLATGGSLEWMQKDKGTTTAVGLWKGITDQRVTNLRGDPFITNVVYSVAFSPDGRTLAAGNAREFETRRCPVLLWEVPSGKLRRTFEGDMSFVFAVQFSPDGTILATGGDAADEKTPSLKLWDVATGKVKTEFKGMKGRIRSVAFSPDGKLLASTEEDVKKDIGELALWDIGERKRVATLTGHQCFACSVTFSHDGKLLASAGGDPFYKIAELFLWDVKTLKKIASLKGHKDLITAVAFSPDGTMLASGSQDGTVRLWYLREHPPAKDKQDH